MPDVIATVGRPMIGTFYRVPTVRYEWHGRIRDWPVIGKRHSDEEIIRFTPQHYHVDARFIAERDLLFLRALSLYLTKAPYEFVTPLSYPDTGHYPPLPLPVWRIRKMRREWATYPAEQVARAWGPRLQSHYAGRACKSSGTALLCPHQGAWVSRTGGEVLTCPLHGLRINAASGAVEAA
jgi:hypothetical protein